MSAGAVATTLREPGNRRRLLTAGIACLVIAALGGTAAADVIFGGSPPYQGTKRAYVTILPHHSSRYLNVPEASTVPGTPIIQWDHAGPNAMNSQWEMLPAAGSSDRSRINIRNRSSRQCLSVDSTKPAPVVQRPCDGRQSQIWLVRRVSTGNPAPSGIGNIGDYSTLTNAYSGLDMNLSGASKDAGAELGQWPRTPGAQNAEFYVGPTYDVKD